MRKLLSNTYFPFGSQYYRAPSPHKNEWENDLKNMSELGFNTVKFWVQWRWNNPEEDKFYFDDIDELMDLSEKYNLKVMLNTIFDVAPAWIYKKYPDASMVTLSGRKIGPQTQPHRQIGGLGYCFNHDGVMQYFFRFLESTIERYKDHPALEIWNVGSEPELTSSMAEMREYANNIDKIGDMLCYCGNCKIKFRKWLKDKYVKIEVLNERWNRNYTSFENAEIPLTRNTFNDIIDWRMFFVHTLGLNVEKRFETAKSIDNGKHPLMCHHVFIQGFPVTSTASDPWNVGRLGDLHGFTQMDDPSMIDILRSCAKDKPVISAEMLMLPGYTLDMPDNIDENDIKRLIFSGIAGNLKGFIFWQYRPEILGREAPLWGLTTLDGKETPWLKSFAEIGKVLQKNADFLLDAKPEKAEVALLYNPENQIFAWASTGQEAFATDSILGLHKALYERNYNIDFIHPIEFDKDILADYKVLIIPFPYLINESIAKAIKNWVYKGGLVISEAYTAGWNIERGHHEKVIPGYGLDKVYQSTQGTVQPVENEKGVEIIVDEKNIYGENLKLKGYLVREEIIPSGSKTIGRFANGESAITIGEYGGGKAVLIGSYICVVSHRENLPLSANFLTRIIENYSDVSKPVVESGRLVRVDSLKSDKNKYMIIFQNKQSKPIDTVVHLTGDIGDEIVEQFSDEIITIERSEDDVEIPIHLEPNEVKVYCD